MQLMIDSSTPLVSLDVTLDTIKATVRQRGGAWELVIDGAARWLARGSVSWTEALKRALDEMQRVLAAAAVTVRFEGDDINACRKWLRDQGLEMQGVKGWRSASRAGMIDYNSGTKRWCACHWPCA